MFDMQKAKTFSERMRLGATIVKKLADVDFPTASEFTTGEHMGRSSDRLANAFGVSRRYFSCFKRRLVYLAMSQRTRRIRSSKSYPGVQSLEGRKAYGHRPDYSHHGEEQSGRSC